MVGIRIVFLILLFIGKGLRGQSQKFTSFDGTTLVFTDEGEGKPVLLIHGFINTRKSWDQTVLKKDLLTKGYRVIIPDLRGNGDSDKPQDDKAYANDAEVRDLLLLMDHLKITKYKAVGYSRGSIVLAKLLTQDKRIKKAVLGGMGIDFTLPDWDRRIMFAAAFAGNTNEVTQGAVDYAKSIHADLRSLHLQQKYQPVTSLKELAALRKKVLVIAGDKDDDNGDPRELQRAIPKAELKIVDGDHNGTYKTLDFSKAVLTFLN
ncbi:alpha/beta hydrolase [Maribacter sp. ANRC-HE7]|uniref:Alpha/beta hydrolase n=1 Tax=Maribacter aquimaris TaxID=2737171 RepID=A0ABR7V097_9FLAO|nr:alpha/beta hydrolase [Maribacter aquimaris]MBD0776598.1 alpha/beta hydrolase [Maribacter aquimaris]